MKSSTIILAVLATLCLQQASAQADSATATTGTATVYFLRSTGYTGSMQGFTAFIDDSLVCKLNNKRFSVHTISPGTHKFTVQFAGKKSKDKAEPISIDIEAGKTYYIQMIFQSGFFANNLYCQEVTASSARTMLPNLKQDTKCLRGDGDD